MISPKNTNNQAYTDLPEDLLLAIKSEFEETFSAQASKGDFFVDGRVYKTELVLRVGYVEKDQIRQINFDTTKEFEIDSKPIEELNELFHSTKDLFFNFFKKSKLDDYSYDWAPYHAISGKSTLVSYKYDATNSKLEAEADKLLGEVNPDSLIVGEMDADEDIEKIIESLQKSKLN